MKTIRELELDGKRVLIRVDFNVPLDERQYITDDSRIRAVLPTLRLALEKGARLILASHLGRPKGKVVATMSLAPVAQRLHERLNVAVRMAPDCVGPDVAAMADSLPVGEVLLLENLRFHAAEQADDDAFGAQLAALCDIYVNDAFAVSHRAHASVSAVTRHAPQSAAGLLLQQELDTFHRAMDSPARPLVAVVGGAKVSSKLNALENLVDRVDKLVVGGAMANTFLRARGIVMGRSLIEADLVDTAADIMDKAAAKGVGFYLPVDVVAAEGPDAGDNVKIVPSGEVPGQWMALDIGPASSLLFRQVLQDARTIVWNGPMGVFETDAFCRGTMAMAGAVADAHALTIVGGGDTDAAVHRSGQADRISYISTGGGAFLTLLEGKVLPAVSALEAA